MAHRQCGEKKNIYCLEGVWWPTQKRHDTLRPMLEMLEQCPDCKCRHVHWRIPEVGTLESRLKEWTLKKYDDYPILMLAFHTDPGTLHVKSDRNGQGEVDLDWLEERLEGRCRGRVIHFSGCSTLNIHHARLRRFVQRTDALAVSGYRQDVDWLVPAAFELVYFADLQRYSFTRHGVEAALRLVRKETGTLADKLGFRIALRDPR